jgi:hypothetical protein
VSILDEIRANDKRVVPVPVPRWGVTLYVHRLSLADKLAAAEFMDGAGTAASIAWFIARSVRDADGVRVFSDDEIAGIPDMDGEATAELWRVVKETSKLFQGEAEADREKKG